MVHEQQFSLLPAIAMTVAAVLATAILRFRLHRSWLTSVDAFLWIEGTVLLASAIQANRVVLSTGLKQWFDPGYSGAPTFLPFLYYTGLALLAAAAFVGALLSN